MKQKDINIDGVQNVDLSEFIREDLSELVTKSYPQVIKEHHGSEFDSFMGIEDSPNIIQENDETIPEPSANEVVIAPKVHIQTHDYAKSSDLEDDFEIARRNIISLANVGTGMIENMLALAKAADHPNAFRVITEAIAAMAKLNVDLIELHEKKATIKNKIDKANGESKADGTTNNQYNQYNLNMTTDEFFAQLKKQGLVGNQDNGEEV